MSQNLELTVVIPVYNEQEIILHVIDDWSKKLNQLAINYCIKVYNDGSKDNTLATLQQAALKNDKVVIVDKKNSGHGPTILKGYKEATSEWIFQVDSDNEMTSEHFDLLWNIRSNYDFVIATRENRISPLPRRVITGVSRLIVKIFYGSGVTDVNAPYRLIRKSFAAESITKIPDDIFAPNIIISGIMIRQKARIKEIPVETLQRQTGEVSIKKWKLFKAATKSMIQTIKFRF